MNGQQNIMCELSSRGWKFSAAFLYVELKVDYSGMWFYNWLVYANCKKFAIDKLRVLEDSKRNG